MDQSEERVELSPQAPDESVGLTHRQRVAVGMFGGVGGALVALAAGPVVGAAVAPLLEAGVQAIVDRFKEFGDQVTAESRLTLEEISDRVLQDERLQYLFEAAGLAAIRTPMAQKRRALARVLAFALGDDAAIDDGQVLVPVIAELEAPHVRVLALLEDSRFEQGPGQDLEMASAQSGEELCQKWAPLGKIYEPVMGTLRRHVLIETNEITPFEFSRDVRWVLSEFGHRVLGYIREQGSA